MRLTTCLSSECLDPAVEYSAFQSSLDDEGAVVSFVGIARSEATAGGKVIGLFLEHHPQLTEASLREIAENAGRRFDVTAVRIIHRYGHIAPREAIVFVAVAALHRRAAFEAAEYAMDRLKTEAVFWKREDAVDGSRWIEPTTDDHADRARWSK